MQPVSFCCCCFVAVVLGIFFFFFSYLTSTFRQGARCSGSTKPKFPMREMLSEVRVHTKLKSPELLSTMMSVTTDWLHDIQKLGVYN